jgi:hypothetical protein
MGAKSKDIMQSCVVKRAIEFTTSFVMEQFIHIISEAFFTDALHPVFSVHAVTRSSNSGKKKGGGSIYFAT